MSFFIGIHRVSVLKTKRPRCKAVFGRAWQPTFVSVNGNPVESLVDGTWGHWVYFKYKDQWYKLDVHPIGFDAFDSINLEAE